MLLVVFIMEMEALDIAIRGDRASEPRETLCETFVE